MKLLKLAKFVVDKEFRFDVLNERGFFNSLPDLKFLNKAYKIKFSRKLNIHEPRTFNEKIQWLKLFDTKPIYSKMVDKLESKTIVANKIGKEYVIPTLGVWNSVAEIDFDQLPRQFVLKCTHNSGGVVVVKEKSELDISLINKRFNKMLNRNFYFHSREMPYKNLKPKIIAEELLTEENLKDFKFFCFDGIVKFFKVDFNRFTKHQANYYDRNLKYMDFGEANFPPDPNYHIKMPDKIHDMILLSEELARGFTFIRIDLYCTNDKIYFGEYTFYPASGFGKFTPEEWDRKIGDLINLPNC